MSQLLKNILGVIAGIVIGGFVNSSLVKLGHILIPPPKGFDLETMEGLAAAMKEFTAIDFLMPFLAHAFGTLVGVFVAVKISKSIHVAIPLIIGGFFLVGGIVMVTMVPSPLWFSALDLLVAYIPAAFLGARLART